MRKRIKIGRVTKILSCANGKLIRYTFLVLCAFMFGSCIYKSPQKNKDSEERKMFFRFDSRNASQVVRGALLKDTYYVVYTDTALGLHHECLCVDEETANMVNTAIQSENGRLEGYLVLDGDMYHYNHEIK